MKTAAAADVEPSSGARGVISGDPPRQWEPPQPGPCEVIGESEPMKTVFDLMARVADSDASVLITGESGTGKEVVAQALHRRSRRGAGPFVAINCAAMPEALLESELFGHTKGAFTDAHTAHLGLFVQASGGTVLLDEIGDMPLGLQPKLLCALQERTVRPLGGNHEVPFDVRVIAATNRDLEVAVQEQRFREDLYYRINVIQIDLPPLRIRGSDVLLLARHFLHQFATQADKGAVTLSSAAAARLLSYAWPVNVRELQNCIERAVALTRFGEITEDDLPEKIKSHPQAPDAPIADDPSEIVPLEEIERRYILRVFEKVGRNKSLTAQLLGLDRKTLYRKLDRYGILAREK